MAMLTPEQLARLQQLTGTPSGVQKVEIGDHLEGYLAGNKVLDFFIK
jgi:hypothetical protein